MTLDEIVDAWRADGLDEDGVFRALVAKDWSEPAPRPEPALPGEDGHGRWYSEVLDHREHADSWTRVEVLVGAGLLPVRAVDRARDLLLEEPE